MLIPRILVYLIRFPFKIIFTPVLITALIYIFCLRCSKFGFSRQSLIDWVQYDVFGFADLLDCVIDITLIVLTLGLFGILLEASETRK